MQATRFWVLIHCVLLLSSGVFLCCGTDEATTGPRAAGGTSGGAHEPVGGEGSSTPSAGNGLGGAGPSNGAGEASGGSGENPLGGAANGGASSPGAAGSGPDQLSVEKLSLCARLTQRNTHAFNVARAYDHAVYADCRIKWVTGLYLQAKARDDFLNNLQSWNLAFWGCGDDPVASFALIFGTAPLSAGDAAALIEKYMSVATADLDLSPAEILEMRAALERLSQRVVDDPSLDLTGSVCDTGAGGAAGAGGADSGNAAGAGGTSDRGSAGHGGTP